MTGDGVNDAPALKTAISVSVWESLVQRFLGGFDMILADDNLRLLSSQLKKDVRSSQIFKRLFTPSLSANTAEVLTIFFLSTLFGWDVLQPVHLLWINLVTIPSQLLLWVEPAEPGVMTHKPRGRKASFFSGGVLSSIIYQVYSSCYCYECLWTCLLPSSCG